MPLTTLDATPALVVIDLQKGIVGMQTAHPTGEIIGRTAQLAGAFRQRGLPVVLVNLTAAAPGRTDDQRPNFSPPAGWSDLVPELEQRPDDHLVSKQRVGAFIGTPLDEILRQRGVTQLFVTGVATSMGVESTVRSAHDHGYNVVVVVDAITDRDLDAHRHSVEKVFPRMAETDTTDNILRLMEPARS